MVAHSANERRILEAYQRGKEVMAERFEIPVKEMPTLVIKQATMQPHYDRRHNLIRISSQEKQVGPMVGEELGHYVRDRLTADLGDTQYPSSQKNNKEALTHEFFGFLGRMILFEGLSKDERKQLFPEGYPAHTVEDQKIYLKQAHAGAAMKRTAERLYKSKFDELIAKNAKGYDEAIQKREYEKARSATERLRGNNLNETAERYAEEFIDTQLGKGELRKSQATRWNTLSHGRAYKFATGIELNKVDVKKLYTLPEREVRMHFFKANPDYEVALSKKGKKLEELVAIVLLLAISIPAFIAPSHTGYAVAQGSSGKSIIPIILIIISLFLGIRKSVTFK